jgi:DNA polymerase I-like protein with 3'-5' exonuclease and polymerase domains
MMFCALPATKIFHNAQYDVGWLRSMGITINGEIIDTMIAAAIIDENRWSYSLNNVARDYLGEIKAETDLIEAAKDHGVDPKAEMWKLPSETCWVFTRNKMHGSRIYYGKDLKHEIKTQSLETVLGIRM